MMQAIDRNRNVFGKRTINRHTKNRVFTRLNFRIGTPIDVGIDNHFLTNPGLIIFIAHRLYYPGTIRTHGNPKLDIGILTFPNPVIASV